MKNCGKSIVVRVKFETFLPDEKLKFSRGGNRLKKRYFLLILIIFIITTVLLFFRFGGEILVTEDQLDGVEEAVLVLLMGSVGDRTLGAFELYEEGKVSHILMVQSYVSGRELLNEKNIHVPDDAELSFRILTELGVPPEDITIVPGDAESTKDEALAIKKYIDNHPEIDTLILTTSKYHTFRSKLIFNKALKNNNVTLYVSPTQYDAYEARSWYKDREDIQRVVTEYIKLANHFFIEQFQME